MSSEFYGTISNTRRDLESQSKCNTKSRQHSRWWTVGIDIPLFAIVLSLIGLYELGVFPSYKSGFFCNDPALAYPFTGDTVSMKLLMITVILLPFVMFWITETIFSESDYSLRTRLTAAARKTLWLYRSYIYGFLFNLSLIEVMKGITGNPRPTFFAICEPNTGKTCNGSEFVPTFECTSTQFSSWMQNDSYHSFPSGHTSLSIYCALFVAWFLQKRAFNWTHRTIFLVPVIQLLFLTFAVISSLTRITDRRHHWWDVTVGAVIGFATAYYAVAVLCDNFSQTKSKQNEGRPILKTPLYDNRRGDTTP